MSLTILELLNAITIFYTYFLSTRTNGLFVHYRALASLLDYDIILTIKIQPQILSDIECNIECSQLTWMSSQSDTVDKACN